MSWMDFLAKLFGVEAKGMIREVGKTVDRTLENAEKKIERLTHNALKASMMFVLIFLGLIFALIGLAQFITAHYTFKPGIGYILVGVVLILLGWFAKAVRS
ncbi:hypothetical protein ACFL1B_03555 [Nanoarchaeota archaeon]